LRKAFCISAALPGILEDIDIYDLRAYAFYPSVCPGIDELARSIREKGLLHPLVVRHTDTKKQYQIIAGNRRYVACKSLGWRKIPCHIIEIADDKEAFELSLIENIQRRTLNPLEEAHAFKIYVSDFGWGGVSDLAKKIGKSTSYVDRRLQLLDLPRDVIQKIDGSLLNITVAEELIPIHDQIKQSKLADLISRKRLSIKDVRNLIHKNEDSIYTNNPCEPIQAQEDMSELDIKVSKSLDKLIIVFKQAMSKITDIMQGVEDNWIIYEILLQHRNVLNAQIDLLIRQKKKIYEPH